MYHSLFCMTSMPLSPLMRSCADPDSDAADPVHPATERPDIMVVGSNDRDKPLYFMSHFSYAKQRKIPTFPHLMTYNHPEVQGFIQDLRVSPYVVVCFKHSHSQDVTTACPQESKIPIQGPKHISPLHAVPLLCCAWRLDITCPVTTQARACQCPI